MIVALGSVCIVGRDVDDIAGLDRDILISNGVARSDFGSFLDTCQDSLVVFRRSVRTVSRAMARGRPG